MLPLPIIDAARAACVLALAAVAAMLLAAGQSLADDARPLRGLALVIGNGEYQHLQPLANPANDARAIETLLDGLGFQTTLVPDRNARQLSRALDSFIEDAAGADVAVVYYAGHGIEAGGENFLVPVDADPAALDAAAERLVPVSPFVARLQAAVPLAIVMLDACRDNPFPAGALVRLDAASAAVPMGASGLGETRGAARLTQPKPGMESIGTVIAFAAEPGHPALDGEPGANSPYSSAVLRHLDAMAGSEEFGVVMRMVADEVYLKTSGRQRPWINESLRRRLYFGAAPPSVAGEQGEMLTERRQLLVTIAALPDSQRRLVERVANEDGAPMDAVYGLLRALGSDIPDEPAQLEALLRSEAERFARVLAEREAISNPDPEIVRLSALADDAEREGLLSAADRFRQRAKARYLELEPTLASQEAALRLRFIEGAAVFARSAETKALAFDHLAAARDYAEAFGRVEKRDAPLAWRYKLAEAGALADHGNYKGDKAALTQAIAAYGQALEIAPRDAAPLDWAATQNNLGTALQTLGGRESGTATLEAAVEAYRAALQERTRERVPLEWAMTQNNLGNVLWTLGERESGTARLEGAVEAYRAALTQFTRQNAPLDWARTQGNLGNALWTLGRREGGTARLEEAVAAFRAALEEYTSEGAPLDWARVQNNLGNALWTLGQHEKGTARLEEAVAAYRAALQKRTRERVPLDWAATQNNLGAVLWTLGEIEGSNARVREAVEAFRAALLELTRQRAPLEWAATQNNIGSALSTLGERANDTAVLQESVAAFRAALEERTRERVPLEWAATQNNLGTALWALGERQGGTARLEEAVLAYRAALQERSRESVPLEWAATQNNLGAALEAIGRRESGTARLEEAVQAYRAALEERSRERVPIDWATTQNNLGPALIELGKRSGRRRDAEAGRAAIVAAWEVFREAGLTQHDDYFRQRIADADRAVAALQ